MLLWHELFAVKLNIFLFGTLLRGGNCAGFTFVYFYLVFRMCDFDILYAMRNKVKGGKN